MLKLSTYSTRNNRKVVLTSSGERQFQNGTAQPETKTVFKGNLFKADGTSIDSEHEWIDSLRTGVLGEHVNQNSAYQTLSELDLVQHIG